MESHENGSNSDISFSAEALQPPDASSENPVSPDIPFFHLLESERLLAPVETVELPAAPTDRPEADEAFRRLLGAESNEHIGDSPSLAAAPNLDSTNAVFNKYIALFGRDSLCVAEKVDAVYPRLMRTTVLELAKCQGAATNAMSEEEPGRIPHEVRDPSSPIAQELTRNNGWGWPYYGSVDATPMFVNDLLHCAKSDPDFLQTTYEGRDGDSHTLEYALEQSVGWLEFKTGSNPEGLVEFRTSNNRGIGKGGIANQVWKDSADSYHHKDGTLANHNQGIAAIEVQALTYDALLGAAEHYDSVLPEKAADLRQRAEKLKSSVQTNFWVEDARGGFFAIGTDRDDAGKIRPLDIRTSNMGLVLNSRLLDDNIPEDARRVTDTIKTLFSETMLSPHGIRTLASDEKRYRSGAYHNGSIWPKDTHDIALGLARHGYYGLARELNQRTESIVDETHQYPEFVRSGGSQEPLLTDRVIKVWDDKLQWENHVEEPAQPDQAWTIATMVAIEQEKRTWPPAATAPDKRELEQELLADV